MVEKRPRCLKPFFVGVGAFIKVAKKGDLFFIYVFPSPNVESHPHEILS